jgi:23S rRNA (adenine2503-C2)-methyltransferase
LNLSTITKEDLEAFVVNLGHPKFRANQVWQWIRVQGETDVEQMTNIPKKLRSQLEQFSKSTALEIAFEMKSKDGTIKRAYRCHDGQVIESVLMPYADGRYTACISSQAGCAQGCVFCATGQMGLSRQLTSDEIFEQVARFAAELNQQEHQKAKGKNHIATEQSSQQQDTRSRSMRLSNIVFMGMGEPLANYRHLKTAIQRITQDLGIAQIS